MNDLQHAGPAQAPPLLMGQLIFALTGTGGLFEFLL